MKRESEGQIAVNGEIIMEEDCCCVEEWGINSRVERERSRSCIYFVVAETTSQTRACAKQRASTMISFVENN